MPAGRIQRLRDRQVHRLGAHELDVGPRGVEVGVVGHHVAPLAHHAEQDALGGPSLMGGDHVLEAEHVLHRAAEVFEARASGVAFVAQHHGGPLAGAHGRRPRIGEQVDQDPIGRQEKQVVARPAQQRLPLSASGPANGLDGLDTEWLDNGLDGHGFPRPARMRCARTATARAACPAAWRQRPFSSRKTKRAVKGCAPGTRTAGKAFRSGKGAGTLQGQRSICTEPRTLTATSVRPPSRGTGVASAGTLRAWAR